MKTLKKDGFNMTVKINYENEAKMEMKALNYFQAFRMIFFF